MIRLSCWLVECVSCWERGCGQVKFLRSSWSGASSWGGGCVVDGGKNSGTRFSLVVIITGT